jgi:hypothetical protein
MEAGYWIPFRKMAIPDEKTVTGSQEDIFGHYAITPEGLFKTARDLLSTQHAQGFTSLGSVDLKQAKQPRKSSLDAGVTSSQT